MTSGQKPHLIKKGKKIRCDTSNHVPFVVPGLPTSSSTSSTSPTSSSQETVTDTESPATSRSEKASEDSSARGNSRVVSCKVCRIGYRSSGMDWLMKVFQKIEMLPVLLMNYLWGREQKWYRVNTTYLLISRKNRNCEICLRTKITRASCRRRAGTVVPRAENIGDLRTADHKVLSEGCESRHNHQYAVVVQNLATQWIQSYPCKAETSQETQKSLQKFLEPTRKPKVIYTDDSLELGKACGEITWNHCTSTPHRSETHGIAERTVRSV